MTNQRPELTKHRCISTNQRTESIDQRIDFTNQRIELTNQRPELTKQRLELTNQRPVYYLTEMVSDNGGRDQGLRGGASGQLGRGIVARGV